MWMSKKNREHLIAEMNYCIDGVRENLESARESFAEGNEKGWWLADKDARSALQFYDTAQEIAQRLGIQEKIVEPEVRDELIFMRAKGGIHFSSIMSPDVRPNPWRGLQDESKLENYVVIYEYEKHIKELNTEFKKYVDLVLTMKGQSKQNSALEILDAKRVEIVRFLLPLEEKFRSKFGTDPAPFQFTQNLFAYREAALAPKPDALQRFQAFLTGGLKTIFKHPKGPLAAMEQEKGQPDTRPRTLAPRTPAGRQGP